MNEGSSTPGSLYEGILRGETIMAGLQVVYIPVIAAGDPTHPGARAGFIAQSGHVDRVVLCYFWRETGATLTTEQPQIVDSDRLVAFASVAQVIVDQLLAQ